MEIRHFQVSSSIHPFFESLPSFCKLSSLGSLSSIPILFFFSAILLPLESERKRPSTLASWPVSKFSIWVSLFQMICFRRDFVVQIYSKVSYISVPRLSYHCASFCNFAFPSLISPCQFSSGYIFPSNPIITCSFGDFLCSYYSLSRSFRKRQSKRLKASRKPVLNEAKFQQAISQLPPRFSNEELCNVLTVEEDPLVCFEIFNWASQNPRFRHDTFTYLITIKKLGVAKMYQEMDDVVNQVLAVPHIGNEALYNTIIYFFTEARKLTRAVNIFKHMKKSPNLECRPSIRTYNSLFTAMLSRGRNSYINHIYMDTIRCLFKQMVNDGIEPDIYALNSMIKGYVLSLHVNEALRIFHQMGTVYNCMPNAFSYDYLIHGLCAQGRTNNAKELCEEMEKKGFIPSSKSYNSLVNALALNGEVDGAVDYLWEMIRRHKSPDFITYRTVLDEICRQRTVKEAMRLLKEWQEKSLLDGHIYDMLLNVLEDE